MIGWLFKRKNVKNNSNKMLPVSGDDLGNYKDITGRKDFDEEQFSTLIKLDNSEQIDMIKSTLKELAKEYGLIERRVKNLEDNQP